LKRLTILDPYEIPLKRHDSPAAEKRHSYKYAEPGESSRERNREHSDTRSSGREWFRSDEYSRYGEEYPSPAHYDRMYRNRRPADMETYFAGRGYQEEFYRRGWQRYHPYQ
jgi:hypothetical protein